MGIPLKSRRKLPVHLLLVLLLEFWVFIYFSSSLTTDTSFVVSPGLDGIATVTPYYQVTIKPSIIVDANTTYTDVVRLNSPLGYNNTVGIANLTLNSNQIHQFTIFVMNSSERIILYYYANGHTLANSTFYLPSGKTAIMGISIISSVIKAGPTDPIVFVIASFGGYRDIAVISVKPSTTEAFVGDIVNVTVRVKNWGTFAETFNVTWYLDNLGWETRNVANLGAGIQRDLVFQWNTSWVVHGTYSLGASATPVSGEGNLYNNMFPNASSIKLTVLGDINDDGRVNYLDLFALAVAYGSKTGMPSYNVKADFNLDGRINYLDLFTLAIKYGYTEKFVTDNLVTSGGKVYHITIESNSTITNFSFNQANLVFTFDLTGPRGTTGYAKATVPTALMISPFTIYVDNNRIYPIYSGDLNYTNVYFTYHLSTHTVVIQGQAPPH